MSREVSNTFFICLIRASVTLCIFLLVFLLAVISIKGLGQINLEFLVSPMRNFGSQGGIVYQIIGSLLMVISAGLLCLPIAMGTAIYKSEYIHKDSTRTLCTLLVYGLNSIPSVIFGIFGLIFFLNILGLDLSWFIGSIILAIMILPTVGLATFQAVNSVPNMYRESAYALGMNKWQMIRTVLLPQSFQGAITGMLLGLARAIGETAPIMFIATAFSGVGAPGSLFEPVSTLPTHILVLSQQALNPDAVNKAWGSSFVLIILVTCFSCLGLWSRHKMKGMRLT